MGIAAMQWAKLKGALVIGATRSDDKIESMLQMGCDLVVNTSLPIEKSIETILDFSQNQGIDHAVEFTGAPNIQKLIMKTIRTGGTICPVGGDMSQNPFPVRVIDFTKLELNMVGIRGSRIKDQTAYLHALSLGKINPVIYKTMALSEIREAHNLVENSKDVIGKIMLNPWMDKVKTEY